MAWYNVTGIDASNMLAFTQSVNTNLMQNNLGNFFLIVIFFISYIGFSYHEDNPRFNLAAASTIIAVLSIPLRLISLVPDFTPFLCWGILALNLTIFVLSK